MIPGVYSRPAQPGEIISLYGTGLGPVSLPAPNTLITLPIALGVPGTSCEYYMSIGGQPYFATSPYSPPPSQPSLPGNTVVAWIGLVEAGLFQINVLVPNLPTGDYPVWFTIGDPCAFQDNGVTCYVGQSQTGVMITIQN